MKPLRSIQGKVSAISLMLFVLMAGVGAFTIHVFNDFNELSGALRQHWLPSTRLLGDLNNLTSDYRTEEGDALLASGAADLAAREAQLADLGRGVAQAQHAYTAIGHTPDERRLYDTFAADWAAYQLQAGAVLRLAQQGKTAEAVALYRSASRAANDATSDALGVLTARTVEWAQDASTRAARAYVRGRWLIIAALLLAGALLATALGYIRRRISNPLVNMARTMRALAANDTDIHVEGLGRGDEIGEMARAVMVFRANAIELIRTQQGLSEQAAMLEQKLAYEQQLTQLQRNFVVMVSHEFRTPLTIIDAHAQRLTAMKERIASEDMAGRAARIRAAVQRITGLMDRLLTSARLIDGEASLFFRPAEMDLAALLHDVCAFYREASENAQIEECFVPGTLPMSGDRNLLFQAFGNLVANAIKFSPEPAVVRVGARRGEGATIVDVQDNGVGIPAPDRESLFARYYRGSNTGGIVGTGVGLYLVKMVLELHGGDVAVQSTEGAGSCFTVTLPDVG